MNLEARLRRNPGKIYLLNSLWMFLLVMPVVVPFLEQYALGMTEIYELQAIFALSVVILEVPSGYLADLFGRRRSLILAGLCHGTAFTTLAFAHTFGAFATFEIMAAFANSLFSGSDVALLYDTEEALGRLEDGTRALGKKLAWAQMGETLAAPLGGALALGGLDWAARANAVIAWLPLAIACSLVEPARMPLEHHHRENFRRIIRVLFATTSILRYTFLALVAYGLATLLAVWSFQDYWGELALPIGWFGVLWAAYNLAVALTGRIATRLESRLGARAIIVIVAVLPIVGYGGMASCLAMRPALAIGLGIAFGFCFQVGRGLNQVVIKGALNARVPRELRATANSISSLGVRLLFVFLGPCMGMMIDRSGYALGLGAFAGLYLMVLIAIALPLLRAIGIDEAGDAE